MAANGHVYNPHTADSWKEEIKFSFRPCLKATITTPVHLRLSFFLPKPKSMKDAGGASSIPHAKKPDTDNLLKSTMDALTELKVWEDDALVFAIDASKWHGRKVGAQVIIEAVS
jgi:Holliday junction resolvase RusA-like endonuclease